MAAKKKINIGSRGSQLALWQAHWVSKRIKGIFPDADMTIQIIKTQGDKILDAPLAKIGGKGLFVKEIEEALLSGKIDLAVHSMKDMPMDIPDGLHLSAICKREDPRDAFVSFRSESVKTLPKGAVVGTSSLRRTCQLKRLRPDLSFATLRGNVDTRIKKLKEREYDAIVLAVAGMSRLGLDKTITQILEPDICIPAAGQGAIGIECRENDPFISNLTVKLSDHDTATCIRAERAFTKRLNGGCQAPMAVYAHINKTTLSITGMVGSLDGAELVKRTVYDVPDYPEIAGVNLAETLLANGADIILKSILGK